MSFGQDRTVRVGLKATVSDYIGKITAAKKATADFAHAAGDSAKKNKTDWTTVGTGVAVAGAAIAVGVGYAVKTFAEFDSAMSAAAAGTNTTGAALDSLRTAALDAGAATMFSAGEAANAITEMGKAGVSTQDILNGGLTGALSLAAAGQLEVGRAAEIAATALNQFDLAGTDLPHVADLFSAAAGKAQGSVEDVALAMSYVGPVANAMNISIEDTTAVIALLAEQGITGEKAGTGFRGMLLSLTAPSKIAEKAMADLGVELYDSSGAFIGMRGAAGELQDELGHLDEKTRNARLGQIFGNESLTAAIALYKGGAEGVDHWGNEVEDAGHSTRTAAALTNNLKGDLERLGGSIDTVLIKGASGANAPLRAMTKGLDSAVNAFDDLGPAGSTAVFTFAAVTAGILLVGGGALVAVPKLQAMRVSLDVVTGSAGRSALALKLVGRAFALFAAVDGIAVLANWSAQASVAEVSTNDLAFAMLNLRDATGNKEFLDILSGKDMNDSFATWFTGDVENASDALKIFGIRAYEALDQGWEARMARMTTFGAVETKFTKTVTQLDGALAAMVTAGNHEQAAKSFDELTASAVKAGVHIDSISRVFTKYQGALTGLKAPAKTAKDAVDGAAQASAQLSVDLVAAGENANATGSALLVIGKGAVDAEEKIKALAKTIQDDMSKASSAFAGSTDVLGKFDPAAAAEKSKSATEKLTAAQENAQNLREKMAGKEKTSVADRQAIEKAAAALSKARAEASVKYSKAAADKIAAAQEDLQNVRERIADKKKTTIADGQAVEKADDAVSKARTEAATARAQEGTAGLEASYKASIAAGKTFAADLTEVTKRGLDPAIVTKLLQQGPEKAAPALQAMLGKHSSKMIAMVNDSEASLAAINVRVVEQARFTSMAVNSETDQMSKDLGTAMQIDAANASAGGKATVQSLAAQLRIGRGEVRRIAKEFGIGILEGVAGGTNSARKKLDALGRAKVTPKVIVDTSKANTRITTVFDNLRLLDGFAAMATVDVKYNFATADFPGKRTAPVPAFMLPPAGATGGLLVGPGTGTSDSIAMYGSKGEYMVKAAAVERYGVSLFDELNAMRFAGGGLLGSAPQGVSTRSTRYDQPVNIAHATFTDGADLRAAAERERRQHALGSQ